MENKRNYYRILQVQPDAPRAVIKASYHTLMHKLKMHPDLGGDHRNATLLNEAMAVLGKADKRAEYDRRLFGERDMSGVAAGSSGRDSATVNPGPEATKTKPAPDTGTADAENTEPAPESGPGLPPCPFCQTPNPARANAICAGCGSPLRPVDQGLRAVSGRRFLERVPHDIPVIYHVEWPPKQPLVGQVQDLSLAGLRFVTGQFLRPGQRIRLDCAVCRGIAEVVRCQRVTDRAGVRWVVGVAFLTFEVLSTPGSFFSVSA